jgi:hypothetical protein
MATSNALTISRPSSWDDAFNDSMAVDIPTAVVVNQAPPWLVELYERMQEAESDLRVLGKTMKHQATEDHPELVALRTSYNTLASGVQSAYDILKRQGDLERELTGQQLVQVAKACNDFGSNVWATISTLSTTIAEKQDALATGKQRLETAVILVQQAVTVGSRISFIGGFGRLLVPRYGSVISVDLGSVGSVFGIRFGKLYKVWQTA